MKTETRGKTKPRAPRQTKQARLKKRVDTALDELARAELVRALSEIEPAYLFKHALVQDTAQSTLLHGEYKRLNLFVAQAYEKIYADRCVDEFAGLLAQHYGEAGDAEKTFFFARRAGENAFRIHALPEALMQYDTATLLAARLQIPTAELISLYQQRGRVLEVMGRYEDALETYRALYALGKTRGDAQIELGALLPMATLFTIPNNAQNLPQALRVIEDALALARAARDEQAEARLLWNMQQYMYFSGDTQQAIAYSEQALALANRLGLQELRAFVLNDISGALVAVKSVTAALEALSEAREIWRTTNNLPMLLDNLSRTGDTALFGGRVAEAEQFTRQAIELSQKMGNFWNLAFANGQLVQLHLLRGEWRAAFQVCRQIKMAGAQGNFSVAGVAADINAALLLGEVGAPERGIELVTQVVSDENLMEAWRLSILAHLELLRGDLDVTRAALQRAREGSVADDLLTYSPIYIALCSSELARREMRWSDAYTQAHALAERLRTLDARYFLPLALLAEARALADLGDIAAAEKSLAQAEPLAREMQARPVLWQILAEASRLASQRGDVATARARQQQAREIVEWLAERAPDEPSPEFGASLRVSFLNMPRVREVMA